MSMQIDAGMIGVGIFLVVVSIFAAVEQRRTASAYREALAESKARDRELLELQRETTRLLTVIAEKMDRAK